MPSQRVHQAARRRQLLAKAAQEEATALGWIPAALVTGYSGGIVTADYGAGDVPMAHLASYVPTIGDTVAVLLVDGSPLILGQPVGQPAR